jgi:hypothetical protein
MTVYGLLILSGKDPGVPGAARRRAPECQVDGVKDPPLAAAESSAAELSKKFLSGY